ncbi:MAG: FG-GAP-like repeat-containing protein [Anaerolineales bacterium]|nr:FG-GAP-like repeat-containing protein [Anaerolineales bacterium]
MRRNSALIPIFVLGIALYFLQGYLSIRPAAAESSVSDPAQPAFKDVSHLTGIVNNRVADNEIIAGQAWGDYDNDGWVDLYVTDPKGPNTLYRNQGDGSFQVSPLTEEVRLAQAYSAGAIFVDYDNDGWRDLFVANWGAKNLFRNQNGQGFVDVTQAAGIADQGNTKTASWGDFDQDGYLDLYLANWSCYPRCGRTFEGDSDRLYHNNGDGTFSNVSDYLGGSLNGAGFVANFTDFDNDGDLDIYLVNDEFINPVGNKLWRNDGPGCKGWCFKQIAAEAGADSKLFGMGLASGDYDNDGDIDFYFSNVGPMELLQNQGDGTFKDVAEQAGVRTPNSIGWGTVFLDYDNDGWRDLYLAVADTTDHADIGANKLFHNNADGTFSLVACGNEAADVRMSIGVAYADYDQDGWVDLVVGNVDEGYRLYRNQAGGLSDNHWLALELVGAGLVNRDAVGARVYLTTPDGMTQLQEVINGSSMGSGNELVQYFGLGESDQARLRIRWPDGSEQSFENVQADQRYRLTYSEDGSSTLQSISPVFKDSAPARKAISTTTLQAIVLAGLAVVLAVAAGWALRRQSPRTVQRVGWGLTLVAIVVLAGAFYLRMQEIGFEFPQARQGDGLRQLMDQAGVRPLTRLKTPSNELVKLGEALFWDPELSGNRDTSCATCHHSDLATGDNLSVSIGTGGRGLGTERVMGVGRELVPRNAPPIFNLGYEEWKVFFWDGRVFEAENGRFDTPASDRLPEGLDNLLAAQAMFPVTSRDEMRGLQGDQDIFGIKNELGVVLDFTSRPIWDGLMERLLAIPGYVELFQAAYPAIPLEELGFQHAANALAAYENVVFTFEDSPFDRYVNGDENALSGQAREGALLFYGKAGCSECHSTGLLTDQKFHNLAVPQIGPGKGREQPYDLGRARETGNDCDRYAFRTPPLRNVALTGPWMHNGAFTTLEAAVRHQLNPVADLQGYNPEQLSALLKDTCQDAPEVIESVLSTYRPVASQGIQLSDSEVKALLAFLDALTAPSALDLSHTIPESVPSGLRVGGD